jgi:hypothetical protein
MRDKNLHPYASLGLGIALSVVLSGCAGGLEAQRTDYEKLPGSGDRMADGPGLIGNQEGDDYDGGYTIYSDDSSQKSLTRSKKSRRPVAPSSGSALQSAATAAAPAATPTASQQQDYQEFQSYQQYKRFERLPKDSAEYQRFREWQEWKQYQQWRKQEAGQH